jgi:hypothetical protein
MKEENFMLIVETLNPAVKRDAPKAARLLSPHYASE